jgi:hypothetical protein
MQSSLVSLAWMLCARKHLTRRANHLHYFIITPFLKSPMALPDGRFGAIAGKKSSPTIEVVPARARRRIVCAWPSRALAMREA